MAQRWMKNTANGRIVAWTVAQSKKKGMIECDERGRIIVERAPVDDDNLLSVLDSKVAENEHLKAKLAEAKKDLDEYRRIYGPLDAKLPEGKSVEEVLSDTTPLDPDEHKANLGEFARQDELMSKYEAMKKKDLVSLLKEKNSTGSVSATKTSLVQKLIDLEN